MLHRSFKAPKCKTSLKLAVARIKLLRNKREVQVRQMKRDLAQLLESGQDRTARIRVEHVVREEKTMAAYDLIEIYCELIVARLPMIESQKNIPIDLKEAISSIIFVSPRCSDVPELQDVRKHFTAKYGKDFITQCLELRPDCGVNRMIVEKLSARAPDGETKLKILTAIAQEHNVKWDSTSFGESELKPHEDLLNVPSVARRANAIPVEPRNAPSPLAHDQEEGSSMNFTKNVTGSSSNSQVSDHTYTSTPNMKMPTSLNKRSASGTSASGGEFEQPPLNNVNVSFSSKEEWNMEFKDANAAARAAAESAERATRAARAAAEFSIRGEMTRHHSTESNHFFREKLGKSTDPRSKNYDENLEKEDASLKTAAYGMDSAMRNQQRPRSRTDGMGRHSMVDNVGTGERRSSHTIATGISEANTENDVSRINLKKSDMHRQNSSSEMEADNPRWQSQGDYPGQSSINEKTSDFELDHDNYQWHDSNTDSIQGNIRKQSFRSDFSHSLSMSHDHDDVSDHQTYANDGGENPFIDSGQGSMRRETSKPGISDQPALVFDEYGSDDETNLDPEDEYPGNILSPGRNSSHKSGNLHNWSSEQYSSGSLDDKSHARSHFLTEPYTEHSERKEGAIPSESGDLVPAAFDDSDGLDSDIEESMGDVFSRPDSAFQSQKNTFTQSPESNQVTRGIGSVASSQRIETAEVSRKPSSYSSSDDSGSDDAYLERDIGRKHVRGEFGKDYGLVNPPTHRQFSRSRKSLNNSVDLDGDYNAVDGDRHQSQPSSKFSLTNEVKSDYKPIELGSHDNLTDPENLSYSNSESSMEQKFGKLTGGFRHKGYIRPPYLKDYPVETPSQAGQQEVEETPTITGQPIISSTVRTSTESESYDNKKQQNKSMSSKAQRAIVDSDSDDSDVFSFQTDIQQSYMGGRLSRKARDSPAPSDVSGNSMSTSRSEMSASSAKKKSSRQGFDETENVSKPSTRTTNRLSRRTSPGNNISQPKTVHEDNSKLARGSTSVEQQASKPKETEVLMHNESLKSSHSTSVVEQSSTPPTNMQSSETQKMSSLNVGSTSRENSLKKGDGHCGFHCVAQLIGKSYKSGWRQVRRELMKEIMSDTKLYNKVLDKIGHSNDGIEKVVKIVSHVIVPIGHKGYLELLEMSFLIATVYNCIFVTYSYNKLLCATFLPLKRAYDLNLKPHLISIVNVNNNHWVKIKRKHYTPLSPIFNHWEELSSIEAKTWEIIYNDLNKGE